MKILLGILAALALTAILSLIPAGILYLLWVKVVMVFWVTAPALSFGQVYLVTLALGLVLNMLS